MLSADFRQFGRAVSSAAQSALAAVSGATPLAEGTRAAAALLLVDEPAACGPLVARLRELAAGSPATWQHDLAGQHDARPQYAWLALHLHLAAYRLRLEQLDEAQWRIGDAALDVLLPTLRGVERYADEAPPADATDQVLWQVLCWHHLAAIAQRHVDLEVIDSVVQQVCRREGRRHALTPQDHEESPDAWTYRELAGLHALANLALARRSRPWSARVEEVALYHLDHTQPDHVTGEPWAVFAFAWSPRTLVFAQQQLHDAAAYRPGWTAAALLADAAASMRVFG